MEVVLGFDPFLVAEEFDEFGIEVGTGPHERLEVGFDQSNQIFRIEVELWEPATATDSDPPGRFELNRKVINIESLLLEEAAELTQLAFGGAEVVGAAQEQAVAFVVRHDDDVDVVLFIEFEPGKDPVGVGFAFVRPIHRFEDSFDGIESLGRGVLGPLRPARPILVTRSSTDWLFAIAREFICWIFIIFHEVILSNGVGQWRG